MINMPFCSRDQYEGDVVVGSEFSLDCAIAEDLFVRKVADLPRIKDIQVGQVVYMATTVLPGETLRLPLVEIPGGDYWMELIFVNHSSGQLTKESQIDVVAVFTDTTIRPLMTVNITELSRVDARLSIFANNLDQFIGGGAVTFEIRSPSANTSQGGVHIGSLVIARKDRLGLLRAMSNYEWRLKNEIAHFENVYGHPIYQSNNLTNLDQKPKRAVEPVWRPAGISLRPADADYDNNDRHRKLVETTMATLASVSLLDNENVYAYAHRLLSTVLPTTPPNFHDRAKAASRLRPIRVLSLCSGSARIEESIISYCEQPVELTLIDVNRELMEAAAKRFSATHTVKCLLGDVNNGIPGDDEYDVIMCVSALHHVVCIETLLGQINERLAVGGEFWSIGEQIGRNGNRLWPETYQVANRVFKSLPDNYRKNRRSGRVEGGLPNDDFSAGCFEGIRSEELESSLERYFLPVHIFKRNCFLWRLVDLTFVENYNLQNDEDLFHLRRIVAEEAVHWISGGRSTELHGVFQKRALFTRVEGSLNHIL